MSKYKNIESLIEKKKLEVSDLDTLEQFHLNFLGKKGEISLLMKELSQLDTDARKKQAEELNIIKDSVLKFVKDKTGELKNAAMQGQLTSESLDLSLPVMSQSGTIHPITQVIEEVIAIFGDLDFFVAEGPEVETDYNNFTALNTSENHPARQMHDTFYVKSSTDNMPNVLRTHTSPVQIRSMLQQKPPIRLIAPGKTFRRDDDQTHTPMFHQVEGLVIDNESNMSHLKGCLETFLKSFFETESLKMRFRPSHFPFTEPSAEVDIRWKKGWLEILGCGMVHPNVLKMSGINPNEYSGFAFGLGPERIAMLKHNITDLRSFFENDIRFLKQF